MKNEPNQLVAPFGATNRHIMACFFLPLLGFGRVFVSRWLATQTNRLTTLKVESCHNWLATPSRAANYFLLISDTILITLVLFQESNINDYCKLMCFYVEYFLAA